MELLKLLQPNKVMPTTIENIKFFTVTEAAELLKITPQTVRAYIKRGKLKGQRIGRPILITETALRNFIGLAPAKQ
jgi:excisionase family DNA binding protein